MSDPYNTAELPPISAEPDPERQAIEDTIRMHLWLQKNAREQAKETP